MASLLAEYGGNLQAFNQTLMTLKKGCGTTVIILSSLVIIGIVIGLQLWWKWKRTKSTLEDGGFPTVQWRPRFISYKPFEEDQTLMASSTITRILPRMKRLNGPYGMYGTIYGLSTPVIHVAHPIPARAILGGTTMTSNTTKNGSHGQQQHRRRSSIVDMSGSSKAPAYNHFKNFCGEGTFTSDGEDWKSKRASLIHCLIRGTTSSASDVSKQLEKEANRAATDFITQIESLAAQQQEEKKEQSASSDTKNTTDTTCGDQQPKVGAVTTNVVPILQRATVGLIYRYITHDEPSWGISVQPDKNDCIATNCDDSVETSSMSSGDESSAVSSREMENDCTKEPDSSQNSPTSKLLESYLDAIIRIRMIVLAQSRSIWFLLPNWCYRFFSSLHQDEEQTLVPIRHFAREACANAKQGSPLAKLMDMDSHSKGPTINGFSKDIMDEAITLLFAGQDTSAATLSWTLHLLSIYPDVQEKVANEVRGVIGKEALSSSDPFVTRKTISQMPYLDAVVKESMRLYPVAPFVARRLVHDIPVHGGSHNSKDNAILPAGSVACIWIYGIHHNPELWNRAEDFLPERWINPDLKDIGQTNGAYMPFAAGPRNCVGQPLAHIVLRTLLAKLVHRYEFRDDGQVSGVDPKDKRKDMQAGFTVLPTGGLSLSIRRRR